MDYFANPSQKPKCLINQKQQNPFDQHPFFEN